ncbi:MAG TPA: SDR family oxidoreductase [Syntrophothermus lipocalidus]|uniref:SDR family NAD(P)-dependent oxidoreductase n=1 Tax=Syntrophothermus sp. TaxID=2736299 RepID=UPI001829C8FD|nr:SDR family oxidoreductase [Syntrophothermus sp.]NSW82801.1 SDR family oxidoreductase [Syntrophothermus sp.]HHV76388.1 SDR family oxidoreductase [Syntrophothermus lipocalidus]
MLSDLKGKVAVVTGGADGIGKASALKLAQSGADIVIADKNLDGATRVATDIRGMGRRATAIECDLWEYDSVKNMADKAIAEMGKVDILVASGATTVKYAKFFRDLDPHDYAGCLNSQQFARLYAIRALLDHMIEQNYGKIVIVTSDAGRTPTPRESMIGSAAAGLILVTKALAKEFSRWNIRVNGVCLTVIQGTPAFDAVMGTDAKHVFQKAVERAPFGIPTAEDVAEAVLFMASPETDVITGQVISVNGGLSFGG